VELSAPLMNRPLSNDYRFYVVCRTDQSENAEYSVDMVYVKSLDQFPDALKTILSDPNKKLGPVYYGVYGDWGIWFVKKDR